MKPHALVARTAKHLSAANVHGGVFSLASGCLAVAVSPAHRKRALCIVDALVKVLEARGHRVFVEDVKTHNDYWRPMETRPATFVCVDDENIEFALSEPVNLVPLPAMLSDKERRSRAPRNVVRTRSPSGNLCLTIKDGEPHRHWRDRSHRKLESFLPDFIAHLYIVADQRKQFRAAAVERRRNEEQAEQQKKREAERIASHRRRIEDLHGRLERWRLARDLRAYAADIRAIVCTAGADVDIDDALAIHVELALTYADQIDPLSSLRSELAEDTTAP